MLQWSTWQKGEKKKQKAKAKFYDPVTSDFMQISIIWLILLRRECCAAVGQSHPCFSLLCVRVMTAKHRSQVSSALWEKAVMFPLGNNIDSLPSDINARMFRYAIQYSPLRHKNLPSHRYTHTQSHFTGMYSRASTLVIPLPHTDKYTHTHTLPIENFLCFITVLITIIAIVHFQILITALLKAGILGG